MPPKEKGQQYIRIALSIGMLAPILAYIQFVIRHDDIFYFAGVIFGFIALVASFAFVWHVGIYLILISSIMLHFIFGGKIPKEQWNDSAYISLWILPVAAELGVITWFIYSTGHYGGWPGDFIFGIIANILGALCYGNIFLEWFKLRRVKHSV